jgi:hypothetical protein
MAESISGLTPEQTASMSAHAEQWTEIGLCTQAADRPAFEAGARRCYERSGLRWHGRVVWVSSPPVLVLATAVATQLLPGCRQSREPSGPLWTGGSFLEGSVIPALSSALTAVDLVVRDQASGGTADAAVQAGVGEPVRRAVDLAVDRVVDAAVRDTVSGVIGEALQRAVHGAVSDALHMKVSRMVSDALIEAQKELVAQARWGTYIGGQLWAGGVYGGPAYVSFLRDVCHLALHGRLGERARAREQTVRSACWWFPHRDFLMVCERPRELHRALVPAGLSREGAAQRLHRTDGPAISWLDGWSVHCVNGRRVPGWIIERPQDITVAAIESQQNAEVRGIMIETYGRSRYLADCGAEVVDSVPMSHEIHGLRGARLLRRQLEGEPEPIVFLDMINSTPESDGTYRHYLERIDPKAYGGDAARSCHAAMASRWRHRDDSGRLRLTFTRWQDYRPTVES